MMDNQTLISECKRMAAQGKNPEDVLQFLRAEGCSKVTSIAILAKALAVGLGQAKEMVHTSRTWADVRERDDQFHASIPKNLNQKDG
jgi:hypothetical protein